MCNQAGCHAGFWPVRRALSGQNPHRWIDSEAASASTTAHAKSGSARGDATRAQCLYVLFFAPLPIVMLLTMNHERKTETNVAYDYAAHLRVLE